MIASRTHRILALLVSIPIGLLGGLIGLGGAEFRLPVLIGVFKRQAREALPINLAVSLVTLLASLFIRMRVVAEFPLIVLFPTLISIIIGAMTAAFISAGITGKLSNHTLEHWIKVLLISMGVLLILESMIPQVSINLLNAPIIAQGFVGIFTGVLIGMVSSTLGVAGGELIIPTLIFIFGVDVKLAGTASLIISLPTVCVGLIRYTRSKVLFDKTTFLDIVIPMGIGSVIGSGLGGLLFGVISPSLLKALLGAILIYSAIRIFVQQRRVNIKTTTSGSSK